MRQNSEKQKPDFTLFYVILYIYCRNTGIIFVLDFFGVFLNQQLQNYSVFFINVVSFQVHSHVSLFCLKSHGILMSSISLTVKK